jgi:hypothetical protein
MFELQFAKKLNTTYKKIELYADSKMFVSMSSITASVLFGGYLCGVQCTEDPKRWIINVSLEISYVFASLFREHLGKKYREAFC